MYRRQLTLFMSFLGFTSTWLGLCSDLPKETLTKTQRIQCSSNPGPHDYESNTLPLSHAGSLRHQEKETTKAGLNEVYVFLLKHVDLYRNKFTRIRNTAFVLFCSNVQFFQRMGFLTSQY